MGTAFWISRFFIVGLVAFACIGAAQVLKGHELSYAVTHAALWSVITAAVFVTARIIQSRRGQHCEICKDTPEMQER